MPNPKKCKVVVSGGIYADYLVSAGWVRDKNGHASKGFVMESEYRALYSSATHPGPQEWKLIPIYKEGLI